jgi:hypothetical protein
MRILMLLAGILTTFGAGAEEQLQVAAGVAHNTNFESTYGWQLDYAHGLNEHAFLTLGWINEGHQVDDHRDGLTAQIWGRTDLPGRLSLAFGAGGYAYFDTVRDEPHPTTAPYDNNHGLALITSAELTWYMDQSWQVYLRANRMQAEGQLTTMVLIGLGYEFDARLNYTPGHDPALVEPSPTGESLDNEMALYLGRSTLNSFAVEGASAYAVEYRRSLARYADWSVSWLDEGSNNIISRRGMASQLWLVGPMLHERLTFGLGMGVYIAADQDDKVPNIDDSEDKRVSGILSLSASYRFAPRWSARISFNRIVTRYDRDADVILLGGGYRF